MKTLHAFFTLAISLLSASAFAQSPLWQAMNGPGGCAISDIVFDSSGSVYVTTASTYRSDDDGATWTLLPTKASRILTLPNGDLVGDIGTVAISKDKGMTWLSIFSDTGLNAVTTSGEIFVNSNGNLFRSSNEGASWDSLGALPIGGQVYAFYTSTLFLLDNYEFDNNEYLYRSTDNGANWSKVVNGLTTNALSGQSLAGAPGGILFYSDQEGDYKSSDDGRTWTGVDDDADHENPLLAIIPPDLVGESSGAAVNILDTNWKQLKTLSGGLPSSGSQLFLAASPKGEFWLALACGLWKINPSTQTRFTYVAPPDGFVHSLVANGIGSIIASSGPNNSNGWLYSSLDAGQTWTTIGVTERSLMAFDSSHAILTGYSSVARSADSGRTWNQLGPNLGTVISSIVVDPTGIIYVGCDQGVFRSTDEGKTWDQLNVGLTDQNVLSLTVDSLGHVYAGTKNILFVSTDQANSWQVLPFTPPDASGISALVVNTAGDILAVVKDTGIYWSQDRGITWNPIGTGLSGKINAILSTPIGHVFAATDNGVFYLPSGGSAWVDANSGFASVPALSLTRDPAGTVYVGTAGRGVYRSTQFYNRAAPASVAASQSSAAFALSAVYPNPIVASGNFSMSVTQGSSIRIELEDLLGRHVATLADNNYEPGEHQIPLDATRLSNGVYQLRATCGGTEELRRVIVIK